MTMEELTVKVKLDLRFDFADLDEDVTDNIKAALLDLGIAGVEGSAEELDELALSAVKLFCRWRYNYDGRGEQYEKAYNNLKAILAIDGGSRHG